MVPLTEKYSNVQIAPSLKCITDSSKTCAAEDAPHVPDAGASVSVTINAAAQYQTVWGFGGAFTESTATVFYSLPPATQAEVIEDLFGENANGTSLRYSAGRLHIGSCDFSLSYWSYQDSPVNDSTLSNFSTAHDEIAILPLVRAAAAAAGAQGRSIQLVASQWSPPAWMKTNNQRSCFPFVFLDCALLPEWRATWALYLSKYVNATQAALAGTNAALWGITIQNEPAPQTGTEFYEGMCLWPWDEQTLARDYLGPLFRAQHPDIKILGYDHNKGDILLAYAAFLLGDNTTAPYVDGIAYHWYDDTPTDGNFDSLTDVVTAWGEGKLLLATEATVAFDAGFRNVTNPTAWGNGEFYFMEIAGDLNARSIGFVDWNLLLQQDGGPDHGDPTGEECEGLVQCGSNAMLMADLSANPPVVYKTPPYWYIGHVSRFILPGSVIIASNVTVASGAAWNATTFVVVAATVPAAGGGPGAGAADLNVNSTTVAVLMNALDVPAPVTLSDPRYGSVSTTLPPHSIQTWQW